MNRRKLLGFIIKGLSAISGILPATLLAQTTGSRWQEKDKKIVLKITELPASGPWPTSDPFLFCVHHNDQYPSANSELGPDASLAGRDIGQDFSNKDGWNMYHGSKIPGFPRHPHRGFETLTVVKKGYIDHSDSLGAKARYGAGDAQWLTAGDGVVHAEMFPLLDETAGNPMDFFQIWINLPAVSKRADAHFSMFWEQQIPKMVSTDAANRRTRVTVVSGEYLSQRGPAPPPDSWAASVENDVAVWVIKMDAHANWQLPPTAASSQRSLYVVSGEGIHIDAQTVPSRSRIELVADQQLSVQNQGKPTELLLLQGKPISEPVAQYGPFVMNTRQEIQEAFDDYSRTQFGGWKWKDDGPVHGREGRRFAQLIDGSLDEPT